MLRSTRQLYGKKLGTIDGNVGHIKDFYFDDQRRAVRYIVADTGSWLPGHQVLLSPHAFGNFQQEGDSVFVKLSRKQIEKSPAIESHKPVSRQYEEEYYKYYGWPSYWDGGALWGMNEFPIVAPPPIVTGEHRSGHAVPANDPHLRSASAVKGYQIQTTDGEIGHVTDFIIDVSSWLICHLVVETGHWYFGKEIAISPSQIDRISYEESKVFVHVTKHSIQNAKEYEMPHFTYHDNRDFKY